MDKIYTVTLSGKELGLIEKLIAEHGNIVSFDMTYEILSGNKSRQEVKNIVSNLVKKGWLVRIKRGVYVLSDIASRGTTELSQLTIAQIINENSYISFEGALQHYGLFDQYLKIITSVGKKKPIVPNFQIGRSNISSQKMGCLTDIKNITLMAGWLKSRVKKKPS